MENNRFFNRFIGAGLVSRLVVDTTVQMFYAFLPLLASGIGVTPVRFGQLLTVRSSAGLLTPVFGNLAERRGYRVALPLILALGGIGAWLLVSSNRLPIIVIAMFILGIGVSTYQPLLIAYSSATLPAERRARGMGIIEYGWALSSIIGVYIIGQALAVTSWRIPLIILGSILILLGVLFYFLLRNRPDADDTPPISLREQFNITENRAAAFGAIAMQSLIVFSALHLFISYSIWLVDRFDFGPVQLASVVLAFGFIDLCGSGLVTLLLDRLGRRLALLLGTGLTAFSFLLLGPIGRFGVIAALAILFLGRFLFEFTIVSGVITVSEQSPNQRSRVMSLVGFFGTFSQMLAGLTGPVAFNLWGVNGLGIPAGIGFLLAAFFAWRFVRAEVA